MRLAHLDEWDLLNIRINFIIKSFTIYYCSTRREHCVAGMRLSYYTVLMEQENMRP